MEEDPALGGVIPPGSFHHSLPDDFPEPLPSIVVAGSSKRKKNGEANGHSASTAGSSSKRPNPNPEIASISTSGTPFASSSRGSLKKNGSSVSVATLNGHGKSAVSTALSTPSEDKDDPMLDASEAGGDDVDDDEDMTGVGLQALVED